MKFTIKGHRASAFRVFLALSIGMANLPLSVRAEDAVRQGDSAGEEMMKDEAITHDEVVVTGETEKKSSTATFGERSVLDTPFSVGVVDTETIEDQRAYSQREVLKNEPSAMLGLGYIGDDGVSLRGFLNQYGQDYRRVDGLPLASARGGSTPLEDKERVEVLRGVAGLRYGFIPIGGAVNYVRKRPTPETSGSVSFDVDSFGGMLSILDVGGPLGSQSKAGYRVVAADEKMKSFHKYTEGERNMASALVQWKPLPSATLELVAEKMSRRSGFEGFVPISVNGKIFDDLPYDFNPYAPNSEHKVESEGLGLSGALDLADDWTLFIKTHHNVMKNDYRMYGYVSNIQDNGDVDSSDYLSVGDEEIGMTQQAHVEGKFSTGGLKHEVASGLSWRRQMSREGELYNWTGVPSGTYNLYNWPPDFPSTLDTPNLQSGQIRARTDEWGAFLTDFVEITPKWEVLGGARFAKIRTEDFYANSYSDPVTYDKGAVTPTGAVTFKPTERTSAYVLYTEGLEKGGVAPLGTNNYQEQMPPLRTRQYEVGLKAESDRWEGTAAAFQAARALEFVNNANVYVQDGEQLHRGLELTGEVQALPRVRLRAAGMLLDAEQRKTGNPALDGKRPQSVADTQGNGGVILTLLPGLELDNSLYYVGRRSLDSEGIHFIGGYTRWDAGLKYMFQAGGLDYALRLNVENVADQEYIESAQHWGTSFGGWAFRGAPRNVTLSMQAKF